jgi:hypothetical protein
LLGLQRERELAQGWISARQQACRHSYEHAQDPPVASCQADVAGSDHYVLILAARYGTRQSDHGHKSVTELEFEAALAAGCTLHAFFLNFSSDLANAIDDDAGRARLDAFKQRRPPHRPGPLIRPPTPPFLSGIRLTICRSATRAVMACWAANRRWRNWKRCWAMAAGRC